MRGLMGGGAAIGFMEGGAMGGLMASGGGEEGIPINMVSVLGANIFYKEASFLSRLCVDRLSDNSKARHFHNTKYKYVD